MNLKELLNQPNEERQNSGLSTATDVALTGVPATRFFLIFSQAYFPDHIITEAGSVEVTGLIGTQRRYYGNHLLKPLRKGEEPTKKRLIQFGKGIFKDANLLVTSGEKSFQLAQDEGFLQLNASSYNPYGYLRAFKGFSKMAIANL